MRSKSSQTPISAQSNKPPRKPTNKSVRKREYLTSDEVQDLISAAKAIGRYGHRDATLIMLTYRHGLRVGEAANLKWEQVNLEKGNIHVSRLKNGDASVQPLEGGELRALRKLKRETEESPFLFCSERGGPLTERAVHKIVARAGEEAGFSFAVHPHMLRHSTGFQLASKGVDTRAIQGYLGHKNIQHTVTYTQLATNRFKDFGKLL